MHSDRKGMLRKALLRSRWSCQSFFPWPAFKSRFSEDLMFPRGTLSATQPSVRRRGGAQDFPLSCTFNSLPPHKLTKTIKLESASIRSYLIKRVYLPKLRWMNILFFQTEIADFFVSVSLNSCHCDSHTYLPPLPFPVNEVFLDDLQIWWKETELLT